MSAVVDASVVCRWFVAEMGSVAALDFLNRGTVTSPDIMPMEVRETLRRAADLGLASAQMAEDFERVLPMLALDLVPSVHHLTRAFQLSMIISQPIYACVYLAVAESMHGYLVTCDPVFAAAVRRTQRISVSVLLLGEDTAVQAAS
jgi:predicted nucleic acid-binding protein